VHFTAAIRSPGVTLNDRIDYFGQAVNVAARVQQLAGAGEIVLSSDVCRQPDVKTSSRLSMWWKRAGSWKAWRRRSLSFVCAPSAA